MKNFISILLIIFIFPMENFAQTKIGLLPISISFDKKDERSDIEKAAEVRAKLEKIKGRTLEESYDKNDKELNEYEEQFSIMLKKNLIEYLAKNDIELTEIDVESLTEEEREGEKLFYSNASKNILAAAFKNAFKSKLKKPKTSSLENDEPSIFIQTITKKYSQEYVIYMQAIGNYERTIKNKNYRVNNTDLKGTKGSLKVTLLIFEKKEGKIIYITDHALAQYSTNSNGIRSGANIYDKLFAKFGKKMAKKIAKVIN